MKILLTAVICTLFFSSYSQITVSKVTPKKTIGTVKSGGSFLAELFYNVEENDTTYTIMYRNQSYEQLIDIQSFSFSSDDNTLEKLYEIIMTVFDKENAKNKEYQLEVNLDNKPLLISNRLSMGFTFVSIREKNGYLVLTKKQVNKLFGKD